MKKENLYIALDNIRSLYNVGSIMRSMSFFGIRNIILVGYSGKIKSGSGYELHKSIKKTALGSENDVSVTLLDTVKDLVTFSKRKDLNIYSLDLHSKSVDFRTFRLKEGIYVLGNELDGVSKEIIEISKDIIEIKRFGKHTTLNVASVGAILCYKLATYNSV